MRNKRFVRIRYRPSRWVRWRLFSTCHSLHCPLFHVRRRGIWRRQYIPVPRILPSGATWPHRNGLRIRIGPPTLADAGLSSSGRGHGVGDRRRRGRRGARCAQFDRALVQGTGGDPNRGGNRRRPARGDTLARRSHREQVAGRRASPLPTMLPSGVRHADNQPQSQPPAAKSMLTHLVERCIFMLCFPAVPFCQTGRCNLRWYRIL